MSTIALLRTEVLESQPGTGAARPRGARVRQRERDRPRHGPGGHQAERRAVRASSKPETLVVTDLDGRVVEGPFRPSSDLPTHLALYKAFPGDRRRRPHALALRHGRGRRRAARFRASGTTHADYFRGPVPVTDPMTAERDRVGLRVEHRAGHRPALRGPRPDGDARRAGARPRPVLLGRRPRARPRTSRSSSRRSRAWPGTRSRSNPAAQPIAAVAARQALPPEARPGGVLRAGTGTLR